MAIRVRSPQRHETCQKQRNQIKSGPLTYSACKKGAVTNFIENVEESSLNHLSNIPIPPWPGTRKKGPQDHTGYNLRAVQFMKKC